MGASSSLSKDKKRGVCIIALKLENIEINSERKI